MLAVLVSSAFHLSRSMRSKCINQERATHNRYAAHPLCGHPNQVTPLGEDWTHYAELVPCDNSARAARHARGRQEKIYCKKQPWVAIIDNNLDPFCYKCECGTHGDTLSSATHMWSDFQTKLDQWVYEAGLSDDETQQIKTHMDTLRNEVVTESTQGPYNQSYYVLQANWVNYTTQWENYVNRKLDAMRQQAQQRQEDEMYRDARQSSRLLDAMETYIYAPGQLEQLEASRVGLSGDSEDDYSTGKASGSQSHSGRHHGSSSHSHHHRHHHGSSSGSSGGESKTDLMTQWFGGRRRRK